MIEVLSAVAAVVVVLVGSAVFVAWRGWDWSERELQKFEDSEERWK